MTTENPTPETEKVIGRNEPCPCGSGKKYKRCCGAGAAPKLTQPKIDWSAPAPGAGAAGPGLPPGGMPPGFENMNPEMMLQVSQMLQRLPKGQLQKLQSIMQRAMAGKDVSREAAEFERTLPPDFQNMLSSFQMPAMAEAAAAGGAPALPDAFAGGDAGMSTEEARKIVEQAAAEGKISAEQAAALLKGGEETPAQATPGEPAQAGKGGIGKFWKGLTGKK